LHRKHLNCAFSREEELSLEPFGLDSRLPICTKLPGNVVEPAKLPVFFELGGYSTACELHETLQWFPKCSHVLFEPIKNIMLGQGKSSVKFSKVFEKIYAYKLRSKAKFLLLKVARILDR